MSGARRTTQGRPSTTIAAPGLTCPPMPAIVIVEPEPVVADIVVVVALAAEVVEDIVIEFICMMGRRRRPRGG